MIRAAGRSLILAVLPILVILSLAAYLTLRFSGQLESGRAQVRHTFEVSEAARGLLAAVQDAETGQRGFIITGLAPYLEPYRSALTDIPGRLTALRGLVADNPQQLGRVDEIVPLLDNKLAELNETIALRQRGDEEAARAVVLSDRGKVTMDAIRGLISQIMAAEGALLGERAAQNDEVQSSLLYSAMVGLALGLAGLVLGTTMLLRKNRRLRSAEAQLREQAVLLQATLDNCRDGIAAFDVSGKLAAFNRHFFDLLDFPPDLARRGADLARFVDLERQRPCQALTADDPEGDGEAYRQLKVGERDLEVARRPMPGGGFVLSSLDIARRLQAEAIIRQAQKMEAIGRLTGGIAHDFNNLLQVISSNLDLLARSLPTEGEEARRLRNAISGTERGARLTSQLLAFARRQPLDPRVMNLGRFVRELTELLRRTLGEEIEIDAMVAGGLWNTLADPSQIENAILNLAINARDAMPGGGKLTIEVANAFLDDAYAAQHADVSAGQYVLLAVSDTGAGMTPAVAAQAFEPFFTTKPEGEGTGLGLAQVYGFVKQSGGHIKIYSEPGHGTTIKLYLPRSRRPEERISVVPIEPPQGGSETILVVEDDASVRMVVVELLNDLGFRVLTAGGVEAALAILDSGTHVDLLFTDVVMPGPITTRELARRAQQLIPGLAVLFTSGYTENAISHDGRLDEDVLLLSKPYRRDDLARRVRLALESARRPSLASANVAPPPAFDPSRPPPRTILVVEDDVLIRLSTVEMLEQLGYAVEQAATGYAALDLLEHRSDIDALLTDVGLPGMLGLELAATARRQRPELPIILSTGYAIQPNALETAKLMGVAVLSKPFGSGALRDILASLNVEPIPAARQTRLS